MTCDYIKEEIELIAHLPMHEGLWKYHYQREEEIRYDEPSYYRPQLLNSVETAVFLKHQVARNKEEHR